MGYPILNNYLPDINSYIVSVDYSSFVEVSVR